MHSGRVDGQGARLGSSSGLADSPHQTGDLRLHMERTYPCSSTLPACSSSPSPISSIRCTRAHKLQELLGGIYGEMTVAVQPLFQDRNCRMPGKCKDLIMDIATEEMGHVEMIATTVARLLEGAPAAATTKAAVADPVVGAVAYRTQRG